VLVDDTFEVVRDALADRYEVQYEIGRGGMSRVFLATEHKHARQVAIKVLSGSISSAIGRKRFLREVRFAATLNHPNIVPILSAGEAAGLLYYVMPFVSRETVRHRLVRGTRMPMREALQVVAEAADALSHAHSQGVIHRDMKPENILLADGHAIVADFGVARAITKANQEALTKSGIAVGTLPYMSPEQAAGKPVDARTDVYALGCVLHEMLLGRVPDGPMHGASRDSEFEGLSHGVQLVLQKALNANPDARYENGGALANALKRELFAQNGGRVTAQRPMRSGRRPAALAAVVVALVTVFIGVRVFVERSRAIVLVGSFEDLGSPTVEEFGAGLQQVIVSQLRNHRSITATPVIGGIDAITRNEGVSSNAFVLSGRIRWDLGANVPDLRITATLARQHDGSIVWTDQYDVRVADPITTQTEVADRIVRGLLAQRFGR